MLNAVWDWAVGPQDNLGLIVGYLSAGVFAGVAAWQWRRDQRWKQIEHILDRVRASGETPGSVNAMMMLGTEERNVALWDHGQPEKRYVLTTWREAATALIPNLPGLPYIVSPKETAIRDSFGDFFGKLAHVEYLIETGKIPASDAEVLVGPWIAQYSRIEDNHPSKLPRSIRLFIEDSGLTRVQRLFARYKVSLGRGTDLASKELSLDIKQPSLAISKDLDELLVEIGAGEWKRSDEGPNFESVASLSPSEEQRNLLGPTMP